MNMNMNYAYTQQPYSNNYQTILFNQLKSQLIYENHFQYEFCECCSDIKDCLMAWCCWPCFLCCFLDSSARECTCTSCCLGSLSIAILRSKIRGAYKIKGTVCFDCFASCCCPCCSALQLYSELKARGENN